jgi:anti-sigma factor RsiW
MITRDNYEEYFLLYIDNELAIADRRAVERFVSDHPDLQEEWETLLQCRIVPEQHLVFPGRDALHQQEIDFLSYIDGELDDKDREAVEEFVRRHSAGAAELERWRLTISHPDPALVFPDKTSLYKKEDNRKIILLPWFRIGAAAAIIGVAALLWLMPHAPHREGVAAAPGHPSGTGPAVGSQATAAPAAKRAIEPSSGTPATASAEHQAGAPSEHPVSPSAEQTATASSRQPAARSFEKLRNKKNDPAVTPATTAALYNTGKRDEEEGSDPVALRTPEKVQPAGRQDVGVKEVEVKGIGTNVAIVAQQTGIPREESSFATQALQNETNDPENNNSLVVDEPAAAGKARLRGIFRKVTRVFGKTADRDKDGQREVLIGAFQFALK